MHNDLIFDLWLAGHTEREIARKLSVSQQSISKTLKLTTRAKAEAGCNIEKPPIYNVWNIPKCNPHL